MGQVADAVEATASDSLAFVQQYVQDHPSDISDHLEGMYNAALQARPRLIVELGVRGGESTKVLDRVCHDVGGEMLSVDLEPCAYEGVRYGRFFQMDDLEFARRFRELSHIASIDVLFIDTSHMYEHTREEIAAFFPLLSDTALVMFHDTNLRHTYVRRDGSTDGAWDNDRGVVRAIEELLGAHIDETQPCSGQIDRHGVSWHILHDPFCNGFTCLWKQTHSREAVSRVQFGRVFTARPLDVMLS